MTDAEEPMGTKVTVATVEARAVSVRLPKEAEPVICVMLTVPEAARREESSSTQPSSTADSCTRLILSTG